MDSGVLGGLWLDKMCCEMRNHVCYLVVAKCCAFQTRKVLGQAVYPESTSTSQGGCTNKILYQRLSVAVPDIKGNYYLEREFSWGGANLDLRFWKRRRMAQKQ